MPFIGTTPTQGFVSAVNKQSFTANGSTTSFTLSHQVANENDLEVFVGNVRQEPGSGKAYTASGTTLTMSEAPASGLNFYVIFKNKAQVTTTPPDGSVGKAKLNIDGNIAGNTLTDTSNSGNITLDFATYQNFVLTLTGNITLVNPSTEAVGQSGFIVFIHSGSARTVSLGTDYETAGGSGITLSTSGTPTDIVPYIVAASGRILLGTPQLAFA